MKRIAKELQVLTGRSRPTCRSPLSRLRQARRCGRVGWRLTMSDVRLTASANPGQCSTKRSCERRPCQTMRQEQHDHCRHDENSVTDLGQHAEGDNEKSSHTLGHGSRVAPPWPGSSSQWRTRCLPQCAAHPLRTRVSGPLGLVRAPASDRRLSHSPRRSNVIRPPGGRWRRAGQTRGQRRLGPGSEK